MRKQINGLKQRSPKTNRPSTLRKLAVALTSFLTLQACVPPQPVLPTNPDHLSVPIPYSTAQELLGGLKYKFFVQHGPGYVSQAAFTPNQKSALITIFDPKLYSLSHITKGNALQNPQDIDMSNFLAVFNGDFYANGREAPVFANSYGTPYGPVIDGQYNNGTQDRNNWGFFAISNSNVPRCSRANTLEDLSDTKFVVGTENQPFIIDGVLNEQAIPGWFMSTLNEGKNRTVIGVAKDSNVLIGAFVGFNRLEVVEILRAAGVYCANSLDSGSSTYGGAYNIEASGNSVKPRTLIGIGRN